MHLFQGMVDPGDNISITLRKEFAEEAMNCLEVNERDQKHIAKLLEKVFQNGYQVCNANAATATI